MGNYDFKQDLAIAEGTEKEVAEILQESYDAEILGYKRTNEYDILARINEKEYTFEIKEDFYCKKSGNVAVEFECRGKPSGISVSNADFYIYKIHTPSGIVYSMFSTPFLKSKIKKKLYFRTVSGGDAGSNTLNYLFRYSDFITGGEILSLDKS